MQYQHSRWKGSFNKSPRYMIRALGLSLAVLSLAAGCTTTATSSTRTLTATSSPTSVTKSDRQKETLETYINLGLGYLRESNRDGARLYLHKALELDSRSPGANNAMALLYQLEKEEALAEEHYLKAIKYAPDYTVARNNYAVFLMQKGEFQKAFDHFSVAAADIEYLRRAQVFLSLGQAANNLGNTQEAVKAWQKSITLNPRMADPYFNLATVFFNQNNLPQAKQHLDAYNGLVGPTAWGLWLGVRLERAFNNRDGEASKGLALQKLFPYSQENLEYQEWLKAGNNVSSKGNL